MGHNRSNGDNPELLFNNSRSDKLELVNMASFFIREHCDKYMQEHLTYLNVEYKCKVTQRAVISKLVENFQ